jgi:hypothetical protein
MNFVWQKLKLKAVLRIFLFSYRALNKNVVMAGKLHFSVHLMELGLFTQ